MRLPTALVPLLAVVAVCSAARPCAAGDWPQYRGPRRDGQAPGETLPASLPAELKAAWQHPVGGGFSSPVVSRGRVYLLDEQSGQETLHALSPADGSEVWKTGIGESFSDEWGSGPRSTPVVDEDRVYVQSCKGAFRCLSTADGRVLWGTDFEKNYGVVFVGTKVLEGAAIRRGHNGSPLVDGDRIIVHVGSTNGASVVCFDKRTGRELWRCMGDEAAYTSPMLATLAGVPQIVVFTAEALAGLGREDGRALWRVPVKTEAKRHAVSPVLLPGDRVVVASHSYGMLCVKVERDGNGLRATNAWHNRSMKINLSTPVLAHDALFGFGTGQEYVCIDPASGQVRWAQPGFGRGAKTDFAATVVAGDRLLVVNEAGTLSLLAADPSAFHLLGQAQVCGRTWSSPALANGRLYVRDGRSLQCFDLGAVASNPGQRPGPGN